MKYNIIGTGLQIWYYLQNFEKDHADAKKIQHAHITRNIYSMKHQSYGK